MELRLLCHDRQRLWAVLLCYVIVQSRNMLIARNAASPSCALQRQQNSLPESQLWHIVQTSHDFYIFSRGKDKGNHYWALPNHAFDNVLAV